MNDHDHGHDPVDARMLAAADEGCSESRFYISRRALMGTTASLSAWAFLPRSSSAAGNNDREKRLFVVLLQGGMDGLHLVAPIGDPSYTAQRKGLAQSVSELWPLDNSGFFFLNKSMPNFYQAYQDKQAAIVNAIAPPLRIRSHFHCMYNLESGYGSVEGASTVKSGWMNRLLEYLPPGDPVNGVVPPNGLLGNAPLIMTGPQPIFTWTPDRWAHDASRTQTLYDGSDLELSGLLRNGRQVRDMALAKDADASPVVSPAFHGAGKLMRASNGPRISALQVVGFDTHVGERANLSNMFSALDSWLQDFRNGLGEEAWANTVVACVSEFGRTVWDKGRDGTDHGVGGVALLMGGAVNGGRVITDWPGLATLQDGRDLRATVCTRKLFKGILQDHFGITRQALDTEIFPGSQNVRPMVGLIKGVAARSRTAAVRPSVEPSSAGTSQVAQATPEGSNMDQTMTGNMMQ